LASHFFTVSSKERYLADEKFSLISRRATNEFFEINALPTHAIHNTLGTSGNTSSARASGSFSCTIIWQS
jgi:hypothetical protein